MYNISNETDAKDYLHLFFLIIYFSIPYLPQFGAYDVVGPQWYAFSIVNLVILIYLYSYKYLLGELINNYLFLNLLIFLLWCAYTLTYTINLSEGILVYSRIFNTFIAAINMGLLLKNRLHLLPLFSIIVVSFLFCEGIYVLNLFFKNPQKLDLDSLILSIKGNSGNKNIFAAAILFKIPFALYLYFKNQDRFKYLAISSLFLGVVSLFIMNTRSTYLGLFGILLAVAFFSFSIDKKKGVAILTVTFFGFLFSNFFLQIKVNNSTKEYNNYGTTISRVATINFNQSGRKDLWLDGFYAILEHPLKGCGIGNWKIIGATKTHGVEMYKSDWTVPYHVHNDFIEMSVELGLIGGFLFILLFAFLFYIFYWKFKESQTNDSKIFFLLLLLCFFCYLVDSMFNFPLERPVMQLNFALLIAFGLCFVPVKFNFLLPSRYYYFLFFALVLPATIIAKKCYDRLVLQSIVIESHVNGGVMAIEVIDKAVTSDKPFPSLSFSTVPFDAMIANEYAKNNSFDKALNLLDRSKNDNPVLGYNESVKSYIFLKKNMNDSARIYIRQAWNKRPWSSDIYKNALLVAVRDKDVDALNNYFTKYLKFRNTSFTYFEYFKACYNLSAKIDEINFKKAKYIINKFPNDPVSKDLSKFILLNKPVKMSSGKTLSYPEIVKVAYESFINKDYLKALEYYFMANKIDSTEYTHSENIGLLYYNLGKYDKAVLYFLKSLDTGKSINGNSEFYLGLSLVAKNKKDEACKYFTLAKNKGFANANEQIKLNCAY